MPRLSYKPEGVEVPMVWDIDFGKILSPERIAIERACGCGWEEIKDRFFQNRADVVDAFLHVMMKRDRPTLKLPTAGAPGEVVWCDDEIDVDLTDDEALKLAESADQRLEAGEELEPFLLAEVARLRGRLGDLLDEEPGSPKDGA